MNQKLEGSSNMTLNQPYNLDVHETRKPYVHGEAAKVSEAVKFLQQDKRRIREIRAEQIERLAAAKPIVPSGPHPCVVKGSFLLMRFSNPLS